MNLSTGEIESSVAGVSRLVRSLRPVLLVVLVVGGALAWVMPLMVDDQATFGSILPSPALWYLVSGLVVMIKRPWHQVGWFLVLIGFSLGAVGLPDMPARLDPSWGPWFMWVNGTWAGFLLYTAMVGLLVSFPDGLAHRSERDRRIGHWLIGTMSVLTVLSATSSPVGPDGGPLVPNPTGLRLVPRAVSDLGIVPVLLLLAACLVWLWQRHRHVEGEERRRYTLVLYALSMLVPALLFGIFLSATIGNNAWYPAQLGWFSLPVAFAYAVIRHGLYGVDRLVRRTVTYGLVAAVITVAYTVPVLVLPALLGTSNRLVVAVSTLAAAAVFNPARRRIHRMVDRRFDRARYDAEREVGSFVERVSSEVSLTAVLDDLQGVLQRTLAPSSAGVWLGGDLSDPASDRGAATLS